MGKVVAVCVSQAKGTQKINLEEGVLVENHGFLNDAHAGNWHRQVSLLAYESIKDFNTKGANVFHGAFGENLVVEGIDLINLKIGSKLLCNDIVLEITQIGKECHTRCAIYYKMNDCIMPREGVFAKVLHGGKIKVGDNIFLEEVN